MAEEIVLKSRQEKRYAPRSETPLPVILDAELQREFAKIPDKMAFKIGEVADFLQVKTYVLRYWESEFDSLKPKKSRHNQRVYERKDIEALLLIKKLLYRDRYSIEGAKAALKKMRRANQSLREMKSFAEQIETLKDQTEELISDIGRLRQLWAQP